MTEALRSMRDDGFRDAVLWVLQDNPLGPRFYEAGGWQLDGCVKDDELLATRVRQLRYRSTLRSPAS